MSSFAARRRARVIKVSEVDDADAENSSASENDGARQEAARPAISFKSGRKPLRQSGLRKSFTPSDENTTGTEQDAKALDDEESVVIRPTAIRQKKKTVKSKLSFGFRAADVDDGHDDVDERQQHKSVNRPRGGIAIRELPTRALQDDLDRPRYSKEYLSELQSSTPNTPGNISTMPTDDDEMLLDISELQGATIVDAAEATASVPPTTRILSEAEIREKKERRARLAKEQDFLSMDDDDDEDRPGRRKKDETRLVREDEDLGEGFDDFVEDGGLALGKRAEREQRKRLRRQMAEFINAAEGHSSESSSDSDAERRIAYEAAQTKAGLDGLEKPRARLDDQHLQIPTKFSPLPSLSDCLARLQASLVDMENGIESKRAAITQLEMERAQVTKREVEVQALLDEAGRKCQEAMSHGALAGVNFPVAGSDSEFAAQRGLESIGTTPTRIDEDVDMS